MRNEVIAQKVEGLRELMQTYVEQSKEHRERTEKQMGGIYKKVDELDRKVGIQNGRVSKLEEMQKTDRIDLNCLQKKPVVVIFDNYKILGLLAVAFALIINLIPKVFNWVSELLRGINLEIGI